MAETKILARNWKFYMFDEAQTVTDDIFVKIKGVNTFSITPSSEDVDTTDFDSADYDEHMKVGRALEITFEGDYIEDDATGNQDAGQELVNALAEKIGASSVDRFRIESPGGKIKEYKASATLSTAAGGGLKDKTAWGVALKVSGKPTVIDTGTDTAIYQ